MRNVYVVANTDEQAFRDAAQRRLALTGESTTFHFHPHAVPCFQLVTVKGMAFEHKERHEVYEHVSEG